MAYGRASSIPGPNYASLGGVEVGGDTGAAKSGHEVAGVGTAEKVSVGAIEAGRGVKAGGAVPGL